MLCYCAQDDFDQDDFDQDDHDDPPGLLHDVDITAESPDGQVGVQHKL